MTFTATGTYTAGNTFDIQLSNAAGSFGTPVSIGSISNTLTTAQTVPTTIPAGTPSGTGYRIRVVASAPATTSTGTSAALTIVSNPTVSIAPTATQTFVAGGSGNQLTATELPATGTTRQWQVATSAAPTSFSDIAGQTGLTYTPAFATADTYFVRVLSTFAACAAVPSNAVQIDVTAPPANAISTPTFATTALCASTAAALDVTFTASGTYAATNNFLVQLSDAPGSFAAPVTIATLTNNLTTAQTANATIPAGTASGSGYRIRVVADDPAATSAGTSAALTIVSSATVSIAPLGTQTYAVGGSGTQLTATESFATGTTRVWQVASTSGGPFAAMTPAQTGLTYTPTFATAGTYFVRVLSTFAACAAVPSNEVQVNVNNVVPTLTTLSPNTAAVGGAGFTLTVNGSGFVSGAVVSFNGTALTTAFVTGSQLTASVPAAAITATGSYPVTVTNPAPTAGPSTALTFTVTPPLSACLSEGFEGGTVPASWLSTNINITAAAASTGASGASFDGSTTESILVTSELSAPASLSFTLGRSTNTTAKTLVVEVSTTSQTAGFATVATYTNADVTSGGFTTFTVALPSSTAARAWIRFRKLTGSTTSPWRVDNIAVGCGTPTTPRISVAVGSTVIPTGSGSYNLGTVAPGSSSAATTFTILNTGGSSLTLSGTPAVAVSGNTADFTVTQPASTSLAAGASEPFTVTFAPTSNGLKTITLTIANNDGSPSRTPYVFTVRGTGGIVTPPATGNLATGELLLEEDFAYAPSTASIRTQAGWTAHSQSGTGTPIKVVAGSIANPEYPAGVPTANNKAESTGSSEDVNRVFSRSAPSGSTTLYLSAVVNISQLFGDNYILHLLDNTQPGETVARGKLFVSEVSASSYVLGLSVSGSTLASATLGSNVYGVGDNLLVVIKYVTTAGGQDEASLFVFPATAAPALEPATPTIGPIQEANSIAPNTLNAVALRQEGTTPFYAVDGIRVATGWGSAVGKASFAQAAGIINSGNYYSLVVNNADQVTATGPVRIENSLALTSGNVKTSTANSLTLYQAATTTGGSASSFVNGPLARVTGPVAAITVFPVGEGTHYRPLTLNATAQISTTTYTGEIFNTSARTSSVDAPLTRVSAIRYATLAPDVQPTGFSGTLTMNFGIDDFVNYPQDNTFVMAKRNGGGNWQSIGRTSATGMDIGGLPVSGDLTSDVFTSFSDFSLASTAPASNNALNTSNPLPVELSAFSALRQADNAVAVKWTTASEKNSARFEVQRSLGGREFSTIATVAASGNSSQPTIYAALDKTAPAATLYYRLRQVDRDGTFTFSPVATVAGTGVAGKVLLYPNPAQRLISFLAAEPTPYRVLNQLGQVLLHGTTEAGTASITIETLPSGLYLLELQTATGRVVQKFEKQ